jgi:hypothetical protein
MVSNDVPLSKLAWVIGNSREKHALYFEYSLIMGPKKKYNGNVDIPQDKQQILSRFFEWILNDIGPPKPYEILGKTINPFYEISEIRHSIIGKAFNIPNGEYRLNFELVHPSENEPGPSKSYKESDFPVEIREFLSSINELLWDRIRHDLVQRFKLSEDAIPVHLKKYVFIAYREVNEKSKRTAKKLGRFLKEKKMQVWYFPWKVGWADSFADKEEEAIINSFGAVLCITPDFFDGQTAKEEYRALTAKRRRDSNFKLGYLLVGCNHAIVPPFMSDYFGAEVEDDADKKFLGEAERIYRGLLGLPLESLL